MQRNSGEWRALLPGALLLLAALACGGFQLRPTATPGSAGEAAGKSTATTRPARITPTPTQPQPQSLRPGADHYPNPGHRNRGTGRRPGSTRAGSGWDQRAR